MNHRKARIVIAAVVIVVALGWLFARFALPWIDFPTVVRGPRPSAGRPASAAGISSELLQEWLPPAPGDGLAYEIDEPLFNGPDVTLKQRWLWVPEGQSIVERGATDPPIVHVPIGTKFWKDFYLRVGGTTHLVERRMLEKVADDDGFLGWQFHKAHFLPAKPSRRMSIEVSEAQAFFLDPASWLPAQRVPQAVVIELRAADRHEAAYVYPGTAQCGSCHGGATGWYAPGSNVLSFGLTDLLRDKGARARLEQRGWLTREPNDSVADSPRPSMAPSDAGTIGEETSRLVRMLRHNCMSCHNTSQTAMARGTGFMLDPRREYSTEELLAQLSKRGVMMAGDTKPIISPGRPEGSEIMLRLKGEQGRRRMPPEEGGVPDRYQRLIDQTDRWIRMVPQLRREPAR